MTNLLIIFGVAGCLILLLWLAGRRRSSEAGSPGGGVPDDSEYVVRLPPPGLLGRCLSAEDVAFAASVGSRPVLRLLMQERRRLALLWLRLTRQEARRLYELHGRAVRHAADLRPMTEAKLLVEMTLFLIVYEVLAGLVALYGPVRTRALVRSIQGLAGVLSGLGGRIAEAALPVPAPSARAAHGD